MTPFIDYDTLRRDPVIGKRMALAERFLAGDGIEIGALQSPLPVPPAARVRYVDRLTPAQLREHYPEFAQVPVAEVDVVDDGETLATFADGSLDFIIANHMLEHCENPLGAIRNHFRKLRPGGVLFYTVPDKRFTFDSRRPLTDMRHFSDDDLKGPAQSRDAHFNEWARLVAGIDDPAAAAAEALRLKAMDYSIHFHVWDFDSFMYFTDLVRESNPAQDFDWSHIELHRAEILSVFTKR